MRFDVVVPVAFFTADHVDMTATFLEALREEPGCAEVHVFHNGGPVEWSPAASPPMAATRRLPRPQVWIHDARGWSFYRMWNTGIRMCAGIALVLNNDIEWDRGTLAALAEEMDAADPDVALVYPGGEEPRGVAGWCFAVRPQLVKMAGPIDERYITWYGDDELVLLLRRAGLRTEPRPDLQVRHLVTATMGHRPGVEGERMQDRALFLERWG